MWRKGGLDFRIKLEESENVILTGKFRERKRPIKFKNQNEQVSFSLTKSSLMPIKLWQQLPGDPPASTSLHLLTYKTLFSKGDLLFFDPLFLFFFFFWMLRSKSSPQRTIPLHYLNTCIATVPLSSEVVLVSMMLGPAKSKIFFYFFILFFYFPSTKVLWGTK